MAKNKTIKVFRFFEPVFRIHVWFYFHQDWQMLWGFLQEVDPALPGPASPADGVYHQHHTDEGTVSIICLKDLGTLPVIIANLAHEINHLVMRELPCRGIDYSEETREVYAYLTSWITEELVSTYLDARHDKK